MLIVLKAKLVNGYVRTFGSLNNNDLMKKTTADDYFLIAYFDFLVILLMLPLKAILTLKGEIF